MQEFNQEIIKNLLYAGIIYELHIAEEKIGSFEKKYGENFTAFELTVKSSEEDFERWDDYLEWRANMNSRDYLITRKKAIEDENNRVA